MAHPAASGHDDQPMAVPALLPLRTRFVDYDARPEPRTQRYCFRCQRDIRRDQPARVIHLLPAYAGVIIHPGDAKPDGETALLGPDCARIVGLDWSVPEDESAGGAARG